jgi:hypothetical protein
VRSRLAEINVLARGASNAKWHSGCLAPDRCVESICDWLIRGPLFCAAQLVGQTCQSAFLGITKNGRQECLAHAALDEVPADSPDGSLRAIRYADFAQNVLDVFLHSLVTDAQRLGDFFVREAERQLLKNFAFTLSQ